MEWDERRGTRSRGSTLTTNARTEMLETNNEKNKLDMVLWNTTQIMRWQPTTYGKRIGLISTRRRESYFTGRIKEELGSYISTIKVTNLRESFS